MKQKELDDALDLKGFLSPAMGFVRETLIAAYKNSFAAAESASDDAQRSMMEAEVSQKEIHMLASLIFLQRTIRSSQAAIILCQQGLVVDAQTLTRAAAEALFHGVALINEPAVFAKIARKGDEEERKQANGMLQTLQNQGLTEQNIKDLEEIASRGEGEGNTLSVFEAARIANLLPLYQTLYRGLSNVASHATLRSMDSSFAVSDDSWSLVTGPTEQHLELTLRLVRTCLDLSCKALDDNFKR